MEWIQILGIVLGNLAVILPLWLWSRSESRSDNRKIDEHLVAMRELIFSIQLEMKDFHNRLCSIEEKRRL